jgi:hypothetical protein
VVVAILVDVVDVLQDDLLWVVLADLRLDFQTCSDVEGDSLAAAARESLKARSLGRCRANGLDGTSCLPSCNSSSSSLLDKAAAAATDFCREGALATGSTIKPWFAVRVVARVVVVVGLDSLATWSAPGSVECGSLCREFVRLATTLRHRVSNVDDGGMIS